MERREGATVRVRATWMFEGDGPSKIVYGLEKSRRKQNRIEEMERSSNKEIVSGQEEMEKILLSFSWFLSLPFHHHHLNLLLLLLLLFLQHPTLSSPSKWEW